MVMVTVTVTVKPSSTALIRPCPITGTLHALGPLAVPGLLARPHAASPEGHRVKASGANRTGGRVTRR